jgi:hypothetical protein
MPHVGSLPVRTGVYDPRRGPPRDRPIYEVDSADVEQAVRWEMEQRFQV